MNSGSTVLSAIEKLFYLWKMFFLHVRLSGVHESFNSMSPSGRAKVNGRFVGYCIRRGNRLLILIDLYCPAFFGKAGFDMKRMPSVCEYFLLEHSGSPASGFVWRYAADQPTRDSGQYNTAAPSPASRQALHRVRSRLVSERTAVINQIRGFLLERGIIVRQGLRFLRQALPGILAKRTDVLSPRMVRIIADLASDWRQLDERIEPVTNEIETLAKSDSGCRRVMTVPGIGPIISSAMVAAIGSGAAFARGRDFSAWIGLVPKQMSTGDRTILGRISKRGC